LPVASQNEWHRQRSKQRTYRIEQIKVGLPVLSRRMKVNITPWRKVHANVQTVIALENH